MGKIMLERDYGEPFHNPITQSQAHALAEALKGNGPVQKRPFFPPDSDEFLERIIGIPGVIYRWDPEFNGIEFKRKGRCWFRTGLDLSELKPETLDKIRDMMREIISRRSHAKGFVVNL